MGGSSVKHLLFVANSILFCRANKVEWGRIRGILNTYEKSSDQAINKQKSSIFFSSNTKLSSKQEVLWEVGDSICGNYDKYLSLFTLIGKSKYNTFQWIKDRVWQKVSNWKHKFIFRAGREVRIKVVLQALPMYFTNVFLLSKNPCKDITRILLRFY